MIHAEDYAPKGYRLLVQITDRQNRRGGTSACAKGASLNPLTLRKADMYDLTVEKLIGILTEIRDAGHGKDLVVIGQGNGSGPMPVAGVRDSTIVTKQCIGGDMMNVLEDDGRGQPVIVIEEPEMVALVWLKA